MGGQAAPRPESSLRGGQGRLRQGGLALGGLGASWTCRSRATNHRQGGERQGKRTGQSCSAHPKQEQYAISPPVCQRPPLPSPPETLPAKTLRPTSSPTGEPSQNASKEED